VPHARRCCRVGADDDEGGGESFLYTPGAGDDEEAWAGHLTPSMFWAHADDILSAGAAHADAVVRRLVGAQPSAPSWRRAPTRAAASDGAPGLHNLPPRGLRAADPSAVRPAAGGAFVVARGLLLHGGGGDDGAGGCPPPGAADSLLLLLPPGAPLGCDHGWSSAAVVRVESAKAARGSLCSALRPALKHIFDTAWRGRSLLVHDAAGAGHDAGVCVVLAALLCMFAAAAEGGEDSELPAFCWHVADGAGGGSSGGRGGDDEAARIDADFEACIRTAAVNVSKDAVRIRLAAVSARFPAARPTRGSLKQVYNFFVDAAGGRRPGGAGGSGAVLGNI
jgi:tRNA A64-2'-O-ribosylphosphate transferase